MPEPTTNRNEALAQEQRTVDAAYRRRAELLAQLDQTIDAAGAEDVVHAARSTALKHRRAELLHARAGLVFGRLDALDGSTRYVGRVGLPDEADDSEPLVLDWRARAARPFYTATPLDPQGQSRRRHIRVDGKQVVAVDDEPLDAEGSNTELVGEGALLSALSARRTGRMGTAIATLQREQDDIVRAPASGPLVVQGGPGTGKTVVALHRVAYLLFNEPDLASQGVLVLGPSRRFLDYIAQVLPALGETAVVAATCETLLPGVTVEGTESREVAEIKGRHPWQSTIETYVRSLTPLPRPLRFVVDGEVLTVPTDLVRRALATAAGREYHRAREQFVLAVRDHMVEAYVEHHDALVASMEDGFEDILAKVDAGLARSDDRGELNGARGGEVDGGLTDDDVEQLHARLIKDAAVAAVLEEFWPLLEPRAVLAGLLRSDALLRKFAPWLRDDERELVCSANALEKLSASDLPLLDSVADALGSVTGTSEVDEEFIAQRAAAQRDWAYGHIVVDEAQELSAMQWQMVARRVPSRSITAVGDIDQTEAPHRHTTWEQAVSPVFGDRWRRADLTICYRTPREVMALTPPVLAAAGSQNGPPRALRESGYEPWEVDATDQDLPQTVAQLAGQLAQRWDGGMIGVVAPQVHVADLRAHMPHVTVLSATEAKGLEWDAALVVDPHGITREPRGWNGLYVALTRCTQELGQVVLSE